MNLSPDLPARGERREEVWACGIEGKRLTQLEAAAVVGRQNKQPLLKQISLALVVEIDVE